MDAGLDRNGLAPREGGAASHSRRKATDIRHYSTIAADIHIACPSATCVEMKSEGAHRFGAVRYSTRDGVVHVRLTVHEGQRDELEQAWLEIVAGKRPQMDALNHEIAVITERAIRRNPTTGQSRRSVWFLAAVYSGSEFPFDMTELRALDCGLANACLDYLNYDRLGQREVHRHLSNGDVERQQWIEDYNLRPRGRPTD